MANENYVMMANNPTGTGSFSLNRKEGTTIGNFSHTEGYSNEASGDFSHAEGQSTSASNYSSHAEGYNTTASGASSHAEGQNTLASGYSSHAEGECTAASKQCSHAEGSYTTASGLCSHAEGSNFDSSGSVLSNRIVSIFDVNYIIGGSTAYGINSHAEGTQSFAYGYSSHAEGYNTTASGNYSHAEGCDTIASEQYSHAEGSNTHASQRGSHAEGWATTSSAYYSHAEGQLTIASGENSHAEGCRSVAQGSSSHAEGWSDDTESIGSMTVTAVNENVLTFGGTTFASWSEISKGKSIISLQKNKMKMIISDFDSNAKTLTLLSAILVDVGDIVEIYSHGPTIALGKNSHAEGHNTIALGNNSHAEGYETTASGNQSHAEGFQTIASNHESHAEGASTISSGAHAEGLQTTASGYASHAEGELTKASEYYAHAEGVQTIASGSFSHAEGKCTTASNYGSHAEGGFTTASGIGAHAEGKETTASNYASHASGKFNVAMKTGGTEKNTTGTAFVIGNGTSSSALSNAFSVQYNGTVKAKSTITASTTADYAEFFEWIDKNTNEEDRVGHFVTLDGDKIKIATSEDDYILGIVSGEPFVLGNGDCDTWNGMFLHDEFRRTMYEPAPKMIEILDNEGNPTGECEEVEGEYEGTRPILNPDYDPTQKYISRFDRVEWSPVGMLGVLAVLHDGTAEVNGYVTVNDEGIATKCTRDTRNSYRVIKKISDKVVEVIFR